MSHKGDIFPSFRVEGGSLGVQCFGDLMITAPAATHMGFNTGENYCEAVNFGNRFWLSYVKGRMDAGTYPECSYKHKKNCQSITPTPADFQKWENVQHFDSILTKRFARGPRNCQPSSTMCSKCNKIIVGEHYISKETGKPLCSSCREKERMLDRLCSRCNTVRLTKKNRRRVSQEKGSRYICTSCHDAIHKRGTGDKNPKRGRSRSPTPEPEPSRMGTRSSGATSC
nr:PREDICTED: uncharacterized protein LOC109039770 [Bemisia tabaci]XP_018910972.1 PREDICTED: uncharacterized protein LOC109039770 [Bemisia tabaci]